MSSLLAILATNYNVLEIQIVLFWHLLHFIIYRTYYNMCLVLNSVKWWWRSITLVIQLINEKWKNIFWREEADDDNYAQAAIWWLVVVVVEVRIVGPLVYVKVSVRILWPSLWVRLEDVTFPLSTTVLIVLVSEFEELPLVVGGDTMTSVRAGTQASPFKWPK